MRKLLLGFIVLLSLPLYTIAQESVGFSNPDNIQPLLDYRLPEWGYSNVYLDFSLDGIVDRSRFDGADHASSDSRYTTHLSPVYTRYYQSEDRQSNYILSSTFDYFLDKQKESNNDKTSLQNYNFELNLYTEEKFYLEDSDVFLSGSVSGDFDQAKTEDTERQTNQMFAQSDFTRNFNTNLSIGIGFGRIRNVNPIIRSLRLGERLHALNNGQTMDSQDYTSAAEQLTKFGGYNETYDRPQKYFWNDMDALISPDLSAINPFDLLYLTDTTKETIGSRMEGWEVHGTLAFDWTTRYMEDDRFENGSDITKNSTLIPSLTGVWSKNISLKHQLGLSANLTSFLPLDTDDDNRIIASVNASWLYTITDRILSTTNINIYQRLSELDGFITVNSEIDYFIENRFSLFSNVLMNHRPKFLDEDHNRRDTLFIFNTGMRYYFKRGLF